MFKDTPRYPALFLIALVVTLPSAAAYGGFNSHIPVGDSARAQNNKLAQQAIIARCGNEPSKQAMTQLFDEFDIDVFDATVPKDQQVKVGSAHGATENVGILPAVGLIGAVNTAVGVVQKIVSFFGKQYSERLVGSFTNNGYSKFRASAKIMHGQGLPYNNVPRFMELLGRGNNIPEQYWEEMRGIAKWAAYTTSATVTKQTLEFSVGQGGKGKVVQFYMVNDREKQKLEVFTMTVENQFELAKDVFVILEETSQFWGMKSSAKIRFEKRPASLKPDQIKFISDYFSLIALQELADFLEVDNGVPEIKPKGGKASMDVAESDLADTWSPPKTQHLRATHRPKSQHHGYTRWVNNIKQPREKLVLARPGRPAKWNSEDIGSYARNNAPFNTYGDEDIGLYARNNAPFNRYGDEDIGSYARNNAPFNTYGDEEIGERYARNNVPSLWDEDIGSYARNNAPFNTYGDEYKYIGHRNLPPHYHGVRLQRI